MLLHLSFIFECH